MRSGALEMLLWYVLMAVWIFGTIAAIVHSSSGCTPAHGSSCSWRRR